MFAYSFNIHSIQKVGKLGDYHGIRFTQRAPSGNLRVRSLEWHSPHNDHGWHWQLNKWDGAVRRGVGGTMEMVVWKAINFKEIYFKKYMEQIKLLKNFKMLEKEIMRKNYKLKFGYSLEKVFGSTIYFINVGVYDKQDNLVAVPKNSVYYDDLGTLLVTSSAVKYNHKRGIVDELPLDEEEITEDIKLILNYLMNT